MNEWKYFRRRSSSDNAGCSSFVLTPTRRGASNPPAKLPRISLHTDTTLVDNDLYVRKYWTSFCCHFILNFVCCIICHVAKWMHKWEIYQLSTRWWPVSTTPLSFYHPLPEEPRENIRIPFIIPKTRIGLHFRRWWYESVLLLFTQLSVKVEPSQSKGAGKKTEFDLT